MTNIKKNSENKIKTCGIIMPISSMEPNYKEEHWARVKKILWKGIESAGMKPILVWENPGIDVIQNTILQNIYESDLVICDVSGLNPNVMLETGLRLSTKKPTIIITDRVVKPPFDLQNIGHLCYQRDLEFNAIELFLSELAKKLQDISSAEDNGTYTPFAEKFEIKTVTPKSISVTSEDLILENIKYINKSMSIMSKEISELKYKNDDFKEYNSVDTNFYTINISSKNKNLDFNKFFNNITGSLLGKMNIISIDPVNSKTFRITSRENPSYYYDELDLYLLKIFPDSEISIMTEDNASARIGWWKR